MPANNHRDRVLIAKIAAAERWSRAHDRVAATAPARRGLRAKLNGGSCSLSPSVEPDKLAGAQTSSCARTCSD